MEPGIQVAVVPDSTSAYCSVSVTRVISVLAGKLTPLTEQLKGESHELRMRDFLPLAAFTQ